jgi:SAM-dependent methyltransferase
MTHVATKNETLDLINKLDKIPISSCTIVGTYIRYNRDVVQQLTKVRYRIGAELIPRSRPQNYLIWAAPGAGKTYFIEQIAASNPHVTYQELNLAKLEKREFQDTLKHVMEGEGPTLCFIDEVDAKPHTAWPYEILLPSLEPSDNRQRALVFVLAGSTGTSLAEFKQRIEKRPKGRDLLARIPSTNEYAIPPLDQGDRIIIAVSQMLNAATDKGRTFTAIDKLAVYYIAMASHIDNPRQIREFAERVVKRASLDENTIRYDDLFDAGDSGRFAFYNSVMPEAERLATTFVSVDAAPRAEQIEKLSPDSLYTLRFGKYAAERIKAATRLTIDESELDVDDMTLKDLVSKLVGGGVSPDNASRLASTIRESYFTDKYLDYDDSDDLRSVVTDWHWDLAEIVDFTRLRLTDADVIYSGIGNGRDLPFVCPRSKSLAAVDVSARMLERAVKHRPDLIAYHTSAEELAAVPSNAYDVYLALRLYQSALFDISEAVRAARRVIRKGGIAIISLPDAYIDKKGGDLRVVRGLVAHDRLDYLRPYHKATHVLDCLTKAGFVEPGWMRKRADIYVWARAK